MESIQRNGDAQESPHPMTVTLPKTRKCAMAVAPDPAEELNLVAPHNCFRHLSFPGSHTDLA
jgi:hypothetical protein